MNATRLRKIMNRHKPIGTLIVGACLLWQSLKPRKRKTVLAGAGLFTGAFLCIVCAISCSSKNEEEGTTEWKFVSAIHLGIENSDTEIAEYERVTNLAPNPAVIRVTTSKGSFSPDSLEQFRGLVHIDNVQEALRFVRFRTSRKYCYNWSEDKIPQEIVSFSQYKTPGFADTGGANETGQVNTPQSGRYGLLSDAAYREGKFQPPIAKSAAHGYRVVRWVCVYMGLKGSAIQRWQEEVKPDGEYHCAVLQSIPPPKLPDTEWYIYGLA